MRHFFFIEVRSVLDTHSVDAVRQIWDTVCCGQGTGVVRSYVVTETLEIKTKKVKKMNPLEATSTKSCKQTIKIVT